MSLHTAFLFVVPIAALGFLLTFLLREIPLRSSVHDVDRDDVRADARDDGGGEHAASVAHI
jgi:hypothetical protein